MEDDDKEGICAVRQLFDQGLPFEKVVGYMNGIQNYLRNIAEDEDFDLLSAETRQIYNIMMHAVNSLDSQGGGEQDPADDLFE